MAKAKRRPPPKRKAAGTIGTPSAREKFLSLIAQGVSISSAAKGAGSSRTTVYRWRNADESFAEAWDDAHQTGLDMLEDRALKLAHEGSEKLIMFLLEAGRPEKYRKNIKHEHGGKGGGPIILYADDEEL